MPDYYVLGSSSYKKQPLSMNEKSKDICIDLYYILGYFGNNFYSMTDRSNQFYVKFFIGPNMNLYLNDDIDGTADLCVTGPGLLMERPHEECLKTILKQQNA